MPVPGLPRPHMHRGWVWQVRRGMLASGSASGSGARTGWGWGRQSGARPAATLTLGWVASVPTVAAIDVAGLACLRGSKAPPIRPGPVTGQARHMRDKGKAGGRRHWRGRGWAALAVGGGSSRRGQVPTVRGQAGSALRVRGPAPLWLGALDVCCSLVTKLWHGWAGRPCRITPGPWVLMRGPAPRMLAGLLDVVVLLVLKVAALVLLVGLLLVRLVAWSLLVVRALPPGLWVDALLVRHEVAAFLVPALVLALLSASLLLVLLADLALLSASLPTVLLVLVPAVALLAFFVLPVPRVQRNEARHVWRAWWASWRCAACRA